MKKIFVVISLLLVCSICATAASISEEKAEALARKFFFGDYVSKTNVFDLYLVWDGSSLCDATKSSEREGFEFVTPSFYVYNRYGGGFVIISGDDSVDPVIGYSLDGEIDPSNLSPAFEWWMEGVKLTIDANRTVGAVASYDTQLSWKEFENGVSPISSLTKADGKLLNTATWDQGGIFNRDCPNQYYCGCVALAMAELMRYYEHPSAPSQVLIPSYFDDYAEVTRSSRDLTGVTYNFASMPTTYSEANSSVLDKSIKDDIAGLLADIGASVEMGYSSGGSGAHSEDIVYAMGTYFKYNKAAEIRYRSYYTEKDWVDMMIASIDAGHPLLAGGSRWKEGSGGHQFIVDGYRSDRLMHFNFGWGGSDNGYYSVGMNTYAKNFSVIVNMYPENDSTPEEFGTPDLDFYYHDSADWPKGLSLSKGPVSPGVRFEMRFGGVTCNGPVDFSGYFHPFLISKDGSELDCIDTGYTYSPSTVDRGHIYIKYAYGKIPSTHKVELGDRIAVKYSTLEKGPWKKMVHPIDGSVVGEYPLIQDAAFIDLPSTCYRGDQFELCLKNTPYTYSSITWSVNNSSGQSTSIGQGEGDIQSYDRSIVKFSSAGKYTVKAVVKSGTDVIDTIIATISVQ